jgi:membrane associated rhomboid family serine protease
VTRKHGSTARWADAMEISTLLVGVMFLVALLNAVLPVDLRGLGIVPRTERGLIGIPLSPLLHLGWAHLCANALPLFVLLVLLFSHAAYGPVRSLAWIWIGSGLGTWLIGRGNAVHIGASSLIYGLVVYLIVASWWMRSWRSIVFAGLVLLFYGGIFYGVVPHRGMISWEGHLAGAVTGFLVAYSNHGQRRF